MTETRFRTIASFRNYVANLAHKTGWLVSSAARTDGLPCLVLVRRGRLVFAEIKQYSCGRGDIPPDSAQWIMELAATRGAECWVWGASDMKKIKEVLA